MTSHLAVGDAVSNDVIGMCDALERRGWQARMFAGSSDLVDRQVYPASEVSEFLQQPDDLLIYHYSIAWDPGIALLRSVSARKAIKYHNVTPPEFFAGISPWHEEKCRIGREEIKDIVNADCDLYLADSEFNRLDLLLEGADEHKSFVVPPFHHAEYLQMVDADLETLDLYRDGKTNILMVGRIAPHKRHDDLIKAFALYHHNYKRESRLIIVGKEEAAFAKYSQRLREITKFLSLDDSVLFVGAAGNRELKAYYLLSNAFAIASEHEGFCVPIIEAMSMKVPVVAYGSSAIPATIADAGIVVRPRDPSLMAEALNRVCGDEAVSFAIGQVAAERYRRHFTTAQTEAQLFEAVASTQTPAATV